MQARRVALGCGFDPVLKDGIHRTGLGSHDRLDLAGARPCPIGFADELVQIPLESGKPIDVGVAKLDQHLVSAGFAPGSPTPEQRASFERAAKSGVVIVQCSRASGRVAPRRRPRESGIVAGEDFSPQKARILLMLMLSATTDIAEIQQAFQTY